MNLVWHQFKKDARQSRAFLAVWFALLGLNLAVNQGWVGNVAYSSTRGFDRASNIWAGMLPTLLWLVAIVLTSLLMLSDSPARRDRFLATRPMPATAVSAAKILFILGLIVGPWVLQELANLAWQSVPGWVVERGTMERLLRVLPSVAICAAFAVLWPGPMPWARGAFIAFAGFAVIALAQFLLERYCHFPGLDFHIEKSHGYFHGFALAAALIILAVWHSRAYRGPAARWAGLCVAVFASLWLTSLAPWNLFQLRPLNPAQAASTLTAADLKVNRRDIFVGKVEDPNKPGTERLVVNARPRMQPLPAGETIEWLARRASLLDADGHYVLGKPRAQVFGSPFNGMIGRLGADRADCRVWAAEFPEDILFSEGGAGGLNMDSPYFFLNYFDYPTNKGLFQQPLTIDAELEAQVYQWRKIADLPLQSGATSKDEFGTWKVFGLDRFKGDSKKSWHLYLERRQINLGTAPDSRCSGGDNGPLNRMEVMIYDPVDDGVLLPAYLDENNTDRGTETALPRYYIRADFYELNGALLRLDKERCRLIVFEKTWLGTAQQPWRSPEFTLDEKIEQGGEPGSNRQAINQAEFNQRFEALPEARRGMDRRESGRYLLEALQLVNAYARELRTNEPLVVQMSRLVPEHLDLILDALPVVKGAAEIALVNAVTVGATEAQQPAILDALPRIPVLSDVVLARGWTAGARPGIEELIRTQRPLPEAAVKLIVSLHDPALNAALLDDFAEDPWPYKDNLLRKVPGLEPDLKSIILQKWRADGMILRNPLFELFGNSFRLAMHYGDTNALHRVYQVLRDPDNSDFSVMDGVVSTGLEETVQMPRITASENRPAKVLGWMRRHREEDFVFNEAKRKFVLKGNQ